MPDCLFCHLLKEDKLNLIYQDEWVVAFPDTNPKAPRHILIIPKKHLSSVLDLTEDDEVLIGHLFIVAKAIAINEGISKTGFRLVVNTRSHAGQTVNHIHMHLLAGQPLGGMTS